MEKYRKFDDPSCGINPFMPLKTEKRPKLMVFAKIIIGIIFVLAKPPFILLILLLQLILNLVKYLFVVPVLMRFVERLVNMACSKVQLSNFGVNNFRLTYHQDHKDYDFIASERGTLWVRDRIANGDVIICNNACLADYLYLEKTYSPLFTKLAIDKNSGKMGLKKLAFWNIIPYAIGIKFPKEEGAVFHSLKQLVGSQYVNRPVVIFVEGTKTNGRGILTIDDDIIDMLISGSQSEQLKIHSIRFDYNFHYHSPYNSTDPIGIKSAFGLMLQMSNPVLIQYYFNLEEKLKDPSIERSEKVKHITKSLMSRGKEYALKLTYKDHQQFLDYWFNTQKKFYTGDSSDKNKKTK